MIKLEAYEKNHMNVAEALATEAAEENETRKKAQSQKSQQVLTSGVQALMSLQRPSKQKKT